MALPYAIAKISRKSGGSTGKTVSELPKNYKKAPAKKGGKRNGR